MMCHAGGCRAAGTDSPLGRRPRTHMRGWWSDYMHKRVDKRLPGGVLGCTSMDALVSKAHVGCDPRLGALQCH